MMMTIRIVFVWNVLMRITLMRMRMTTIVMIIIISTIIGHS